MLTETIATGIMAASVTGAGLVIAFYALLAAMSDKIIERRVRRLNEKLEEAKGFQTEPHAFESSNLGKTTKRLNSLNDEIDKIKTLPNYLGPFVYADFSLFVFSAAFAFYWLAVTESGRTEILGGLVFMFFIFSLALLLLTGLSGITEIYLTIRDKFEDLKKQKEHAKEEIREAIKGPVQHPT